MGLMSFWNMDKALFNSTPAGRVGILASVCLLALLLVRGFFERFVDRIIGKLNQLCCCALSVAVCSAPHLRDQITRHMYIETRSPPRPIAGNVLVSLIYFSAHSTQYGYLFRLLLLLLLLRPLILIANATLIENRSLKSHFCNSE